MTSLLGLAVFSGLSLNLLLHFALGTVGVIREEGGETESEMEIPFIQLGILFFSVIVLWFFFRSLLPDFARGFTELFLFFPLSALVCVGFELLYDKLFPRVFQRIFPREVPKFWYKKKIFSAFTAYEGLVPASLMITSAVAGGFVDAFILALFFTIGNLMAMLIINEIRRRSALEWVPRYIRGTPLVLVTMGLLSLVFASAAGICLKILEVF